jgi:hypothetical protein
MRFVVRYLGSITSEEVDAILGAGLALMVVTYADRWDGPTTVQQLKAAGIPMGTTVWLDVESIGPSLTPEEIAGKINTWARIVRNAGYDPGLYIGVNVQLTAADLYALVNDRYWHSCSRILDRNGAPNEPQCGCCMRQLRPPNVVVGGSIVDVDVIEQDYEGRVPMWCVAA